MHYKNIANKTIAQLASLLDVNEDVVWRFIYTDIERIRAAGIDLQASHLAKLEHEFTILAEQEEKLKNRVFYLERELQLDTARFESSKRALEKEEIRLKDRSKRLSEDKAGIERRLEDISRNTADIQEQTKGFQEQLAKALEAKRQAIKEKQNAEWEVINQQDSDASAQGTGKWLGFVFGLFAIVGVIIAIYIILKGKN